MPAILGMIGTAFLAIIIALGMYGCPKYDVYQSQLSGQAKLAEADSSREIAVREARAKMESATLLAQAEVERAKGVAAANKIIGDSLKDNEGYLRYLWIQGLESGKNEVIYIPTEGGLPILEADRFGHREPK
jgi:regulator of protease activity HflC (stomatin/prohibitin superfamily)